MSRHRAHRLWRLEGLQLPRRRPRRRAAASRPRPLPAFGPNHVWAYDFVFDASASGQQIKCLTVIDEFTRECLAIDVAGSIRSGRVIEVLTRLVSQHGAPRFLRSDNGPEFVSRAILREADKAPVPEVARKHKVSAQAIYTWRRRFGELQPADVRRLRQLEIENAKLKKLVAERDLEIDTMKEINRRKW